MIWPQNPPPDSAGTQNQNFKVQIISLYYFQNISWYKLLLLLFPLSGSVINIAMENFEVRVISLKTFLKSANFKNLVK